MERGFVTTQFVVAVALSMVFFVMMVNAIAFMYGRGVVRAALDEGVREASPAGRTAADCQAKALEVRASLLGGRMGDGITFACTERGDEIVATAAGAFPSWFPFLPDWRVSATVSAVKEREPAQGAPT